MPNIYRIEENTKYIGYAVENLNTAKKLLELMGDEINNAINSSGLERQRLLAELRNYLNIAKKVQVELGDAKGWIRRVRGARHIELKKEYKRLRKINNTTIRTLNFAIGKTHVSGLNSDEVVENLSRIFCPSIEKDRKVSRQRAKEAEARAKEAEHNAKKAEQEAITATALKEVKKFEAETVAEQNKQKNLELLKDIRASEAQIIAHAREAIDIARAAMQEAIKAENIQKAKEQAEIIKQKSIEIAKISGETEDFMIGQTHEMFDCVLKDVKQKISPMLVGPAGSGKSTVLQQVADALHLKYYPLSVNGQTSEYQIIGYKNANGDYVRSAFREAYENGGLFSFEEIDAGNPNVLTVMNNALSQDFYLFPDACVKKHDDFRLAASANTYGRGANRQYIGRNPLDAATLDRFAMSYVDYDEKLEFEIGPEPKWTDYVQTIRHVVESFGMPIIVSTRAVIFGGLDVKSGTEWDVALEKFIWRGCNQEDIKKIINKVNELQHSYESEKELQR